MMNIDSEEGVAIELMVPFKWEALSDDVLCDNYSAANINTLLLLESMQEQPHRQNEDPKISGSEVERLEAKLNLLIQLVNQLIEASKPLPAKQKLVLTNHSLCWNQDKSLAVDMLVQLTIYIEPSFPQPIKLYARVTENKDNKVKVVFVNLDEQEEEILSKWVFRLHRRTIAMSKR